MKNLVIGKKEVVYSFLQCVQASQNCNRLTSYVLVVLKIVVVEIEGRIEDITYVVES